MEKKKIIIGTFVALILIGAACAGTVYYYLFAPQFHPQRTVYIYIDRDDTADSIYNKSRLSANIMSVSAYYAPSLENDQKFTDWNITNPVPHK